MTLIFSLTNSFTLLSCLFVLCSYQLDAQSNIFDLTKYGGIANETFDNSKALLSAWNDACKWEGKGEVQLLIPQGSYLLNPVVLSGPCKSPIKFMNMGQILAPPGPTDLSYWLEFRYLDGLIVDGGLYNGQGQTTWNHSNLVNPGYAVINMAFVNNTNIRNVVLKNSKKTHISIFACNNVEISQSAISAPQNSPNTDGIRIGLSNYVKIRDTNIGSGDDCITILTGTNNVNITRIRCGPGHGISIGGMGYNPGDEVKNIFVRNCTFTRTLDGVRIKTAANKNPGICSGVSFEDIIMEDANNPIIIDQNYWPTTKFPGDSHVQIEDVKFVNIKGTSASDLAINLQCSGSNPCKDIRLDDIDIAYGVPNGKFPTTNCTNVKGVVTRVKNTGSCSTLNLVQ